MRTQGSLSQRGWMEPTRCHAPFAFLTLATMLVATALLLAATLLAACGGDEAEPSPSASKAADLTGYWVFAGEQSAFPDVMIRVSSTADGYLIEPQSWQGIRWSRVTEDGEALTAEATSPGGDTFIVRLEPAGEMARLSVTPADGASPLFAVDLARPSGDYADLAATFDERLAEARETAVKEGIHALQIAVQSWCVDHGDTYPPARAVGPNGGIAPYVDDWPVNPYTGEPMGPGTEPGTYTYARLDSGQRYRLTGHLQNGEFTVP